MANSLDFLHGIDLVEIDTGPRTIQTVKSSIVGIIGSAGKGPINVPTLIAGSRLEGSSKFGDWAMDGFTIPESLEGVFDQVGAMCIVVNVCDPSVHVSSIANELLAFSKAGRAQAKKRFISDVVVGNSVKAVVRFVGNTLTLPAGATLVSIKSQDGSATYAKGADGATTGPAHYLVAGNVISRINYSGNAIQTGAFVLVEYTATLVAGTDYNLDAETGVFSRIVGGKLVPQAQVVLTAYDYVDASKVTQSDIIGGTVEGQYVGIQAFRGAKSMTQLVPRILCAPYWTHQKPDAFTANAVVAELESIASKIRAVVIADGPNTTEEDAIQYRGDWGSQRVYIVDPWVKVTYPDGQIYNQPASARVCGVISRTDNDLGFWNSPSNKFIQGIVGTSRQIDWAIDDYSSRANYMNANEVSTIIREDGFRLWGNRTTSSDPNWAFLVTRRVADFIEESIILGHLWAVDRNISKNLVQEVVESVNAYIRHLVAIGALLGGKAWASPDLNTKDVLKNGQLFIDFDFTVAAPAEHITFRAHLVDDYFTEIFDTTLTTSAVDGAVAYTAVAG